MSKQLKEFHIQIDKSNQVRIRMNEWKGKRKVYIQGFWAPGEGSKATPEADGYAFGKAITFPPEKAAAILDALRQFVAVHNLANGVPTQATQNAPAKASSPVATPAKKTKPRGEVIATNSVDETEEEF